MSSSHGSRQVSMFPASGSPSRPSGAKTLTPPPTWLTWCRKTFFGLAPPRNKDEEETLLFSENVEESDSMCECPICSSTSKVSLSVASPCQHQACERCWSAWVNQHKATNKPTPCLLCAQPVHSIIFSKNLSSQTNLLRVCEDAFENCVRIILGLKNDLAEIEGKLKSTGDHLGMLQETAQLGELDMDSVVPIVQVEILNVKEQLDALLLQTNNVLPLLPTALVGLNQALKALLASFSDQNVQELDGLSLLFQASSLQAKKIAADKEEEESLPQPIKQRGTTLKMQWDSAFTLLASLMDNSLVVVICFMIPDGANQLNLILDRIKSKLSSTLPNVSAGVAEFETLAAKFILKVKDEEAL